MNKLRLKEIKLLTQGYILSDRNEVSEVHKLNFTLLICKEATLSETVGLEPWIQIIWAGKDLSDALAKGGKWATCLPLLPSSGWQADTADGSRHSPMLAQSPTSHSAPGSCFGAGTDTETYYSSCPLSHHLTKEENWPGERHGSLWASQLI